MVCFKANGVILKIVAIFKLANQKKRTEVFSTRKSTSESWPPWLIAMATFTEMIDKTVRCLFLYYAALTLCQKQLKSLQMAKCERNCSIPFNSYSHSKRYYSRQGPKLTELAPSADSVEMRVKKFIARLYIQYSWSHTLIIEAVIGYYKLINSSSEALKTQVYTQLSPAEEKMILIKHLENF